LGDDAPVRADQHGNDHGSFQLISVIAAAGAPPFGYDDPAGGDRKKY
jgi:hypothetical protein